jgi:hypothetical protein
MSQVCRLRVGMTTFILRKFSTDLSTAFTPTRTPILVRWPRFCFTDFSPKSSSRGSAPVGRRGVRSATRSHTHGDERRPKGFGCPAVACSTRWMVGG